MIRKFVACLAVCLLTLSAAFASFTASGIPDSADLRADIVSTWLTAPMPDVRVRKPEILSDGTDQSFQVRLEETDTEAAIVVAPNAVASVEYIKDNVRFKDKQTVYPRTAPGSWVLFRNKKNGKPERVRWYFNADEDVYVEFRDGSPKTYVDMMVFGSYAARSIPVGISFRKLYTAPFDRIVSLTKRSLPWDKVVCGDVQYHPILQMVSILRKCLPYINYVDDACYNENEELYSITNNKPFELKPADGENYSMEELSIIAAIHNNKLVLSGAGFVKWIVDGITKPLSGENTKLADMVLPTVNYNSLGKKGVSSQQWNISFSLDWCRNLAVAALNAQTTKRTYSYRMGAKDVTGVDVVIEPFVSDIRRGKVVRSAGYVKDSGYSVSELKALLYVLAVTEPRYMYLGAIKQRSAKNADETVFNNCAALFPYFDESGRFNCVVFEHGKEYTIDAFLEIHPEAFVHLNRVEATDFFSPLIK